MKIKSKPSGGRMTKINPFFSVLSMNFGNAMIFDTFSVWSGLLVTTISNWWESGERWNGSRPTQSRKLNTTTISNNKNTVTHTHKNTHTFGWKKATIYIYIVRWSREQKRSLNNITKNKEEEEERLRWKTNNTLTKEWRHKGEKPAHMLNKPEPNASIIRFRKSSRCCFVRWPVRCVSFLFFALPFVFISALSSRVSFFTLRM